MHVSSAAKTAPAKRLSPEATPPPDTFETRRLSAYLQRLNLPAGPTRVVAGQVLTPAELRLRHGVMVYNTLALTRGTALSVAEIAQATRMEARTVTIVCDDLYKCGIVDPHDGGFLAL